MSNTSIEALTERFSDASTSELLTDLADLLGDGLVATSSFQTQSLPLLHLMSIHCPQVRIYFLDTGFHFDETRKFVEELTSRFGLNVVHLKPLLSNEDFIEKYGALHQKDPSMCCYLNKVEPMTRALKGVTAWISGVRRDQTKTRAVMNRFNRQAEGPIKVCPMLDWTGQEVEDYIAEHRLPVHPLLEQGYRSIGCAPCSQPTATGVDPRQGRWVGSQKTECGLHDRFPDLNTSEPKPE